MVRALCEQPTDVARAFARCTERWYAQLAKGRGRLRKRLLSSDDSQLWSAWWELAYARLFSNLGFSVQLEPNIDGQRPDLAVERDDDRTLVEVLMVGPSERVRRDERRMADVEAALANRLVIPMGWLNIMLDESTAEPDGGDIDACVSLLDAFVGDHNSVGSQIDLATATVNGSAAWIPGTVEPGHLNVGPSARMLGDHDRWQRRLQQKLDKYQLMEPGTPLVIAAGMGHWTLTTSDVVDALFGQEQIIVNIEQPERATTRRSGDGVLVPQAGDLPPSRVAGISIAAFRSSSLDDDDCTIDITYVHNPYPSLRQPNDWLNPLTEWQAVGRELVPVRAENARHQIR
jgi:hypothetical protein